MAGRHGWRDPEPGRRRQLRGLPTAETSWRFSTFTVDEYNAIYEQVKSGEITISNSIDELPATTAVTVDVQE